MRFRLARAADASQVAGVYLASRKAHLPFAPLVHSDHDVHVWIRTVLVPSGRVTVALDHDDIVGIIAHSVDDQGRAWIEQLYVAPHRVGTGIGSALLLRALAALPRPVRVYTFAANQGARRFYERHGFVAIAFGDGSGNEERQPDVLYELRG